MAGFGLSGLGLARPVQTPLKPHVSSATVRVHFLCHNLSQTFLEADSQYHYVCTQGIFRALELFLLEKGSDDDS